MWLLSSIYYVTYEHEFFFSGLENWKKRTPDAFKTAPNNLIISFYLPRVSRLCRVCVKTPMCAPITLCVQAYKQECGRKFQSM